MRHIYIAFGANLSNPKKTFPAAQKALEARGVKVVKMSSLWQSPAWPRGQGQPDYINACAQVSFDGGAQELLTKLHETEYEFGRVRSAKNAARALDLDLLDFDGHIISRPEGLIIPHPRMLSRAFVLLPLSEIAPNWADPVRKLGVWDHIARLPLVDTVDIDRL